MEFAQGPEGRRLNANCWRSTGSGGSSHQKPADQQTIPGAPLRSAGSTGSGGYRNHLTSRTADDAPAESVPAGFASSHQKPADSLAREVCIQTNCGAPRVPGAFYCTAHGAAAPAEAEIERDEPLEVDNLIVRSREPEASSNEAASLADAQAMVDAGEARWIDPETPS